MTEDAESDKDREASAEEAQPDELPASQVQNTVDDVPAGDTDLDAVDQELAKAGAKDAWTDARLRQWLGFGGIVAMAAQMLIADAAFFIYGFTNDWVIPPSAMHVWLVATVVQLAIIARGIAYYLFPPGGRQQDASGDET